RVLDRAASPRTTVPYPTPSSHAICGPLTLRTQIHRLLPIEYPPRAADPRTLGPSHGRPSGTLRPVKRAGRIFPSLFHSDPHANLRCPAAGLKIDSDPIAGPYPTRNSNLDLNH